MKKGLVIVIAVALLGGGGIYAKSHNTTNAKSGSSTTAVKSADTSQAANNTTSASAATSSSSNASSTSGYKDGTFTGAAEDTAYGTVQVAAVISGGKITDIKFLQMPGPEEHSKEVTAFSKDPLKASTLAKQSAKIDFVSGATQTSEGYTQSLQAALDQAS